MMSFDIPGFALIGAKDAEADQCQSGVDAMHARATAGDRIRASSNLTGARPEKPKSVRPRLTAIIDPHGDNAPIGQLTTRTCVPNASVHSPMRG